jgi:tetratricopeptide (TPR) repeat protein
MNSVSLLFLPLAFALQTGVSIQSGSVTQQATSKDCAINVAGVAGTVVATCPGIPPRALEGLNRELRKSRRSEDQARHDAEKWREKYDALEATLASSGLSQALMQKADADLNEGNLEQAAQALDEALKQQDQETLQAASTHYLRAKVAEVAFDTKTELDQLATAHRLAPQAIIITTEYGNLLSDLGQPAEAERVFSELLAEAEAAKNIQAQAMSLMNRAASFRYQYRYAEALDDLIQAAGLWDLSARNNAANARNNQAIAYSSAADVSLLEGHPEEAKMMFDKAVQAEQFELQIPGGKADREGGLNLSVILLHYAQMLLGFGDLQGASDKNSLAVNYSTGQVDRSLQVRQTAVQAELKSFDCLLQARKGNLKAAEKLCDQSIVALDAIRSQVDNHGHNYKSNLAEAFFYRGAVAEDEKDWTPASISFKKALSIWKEIVDENAKQYALEQVRADWYLTGALYFMGNKEEATLEAHRTIDLANKLPPQLSEFARQAIKECSSVLEAASK